jgi:2-phospho-L-lactate guanylyltransferase
VTDRDSARQQIERKAIADFEKKPRNTGIIRTGAARGPVHEPEPTTEWFVVVPVKGTSSAKSRLGAEPDVALAIALDTVEAALAAPSVRGVIVVTSAEAAVRFDETDAFVVVSPPKGLAAAILLGLETAEAFSEAGRGTAVLLGDLPALLPSELEAALQAARALPHAMVADADGTGTTLVTAADGESHATAFGEGSAGAHRGAGYVPLDVDAASGLRRDVDTPADLEELTGRLGPRTTAALGHPAG